MKKVHFIAIGGSAMHNLAIALHLKGYCVSGSDDEIFDPAKTRLKKYGLLPATEGWDDRKITPDLDAIILGMHARKDNPELLRAQTLGIQIFSYPEFLYEQSRDKKRVVIGGSHGKTTITSMILHVLESCEKKYDYMVGAQLAGFEVMVKLSDDAPLMILEGDEYLTSPIDLRPKFHLYRPDIALINGIAWDHINVFPTFPIYAEQFRLFAETIMPHGHLVYYSEDVENQKIASLQRDDVGRHPYNLPAYRIENGKTILLFQDREYPLQIFGQHNLQNLCGAWKVCQLLDISDEEFLRAISTFAGASKRLEWVCGNDDTAVYKDFAHAPSKLKATVKAVREQFPNRYLVACLELHTFSSLTPEFLNEYVGAFNDANEAIVYFNPHTLAHKKLPPITQEQVKTAFARPDIQVYNDSEQLQNDLRKKSWKNVNLLLMSSGNFDGLQEKKLLDGLI